MPPGLSNFHCLLFSREPISLSLFSDLFDDTSTLSYLKSTLYFKQIWAHSMHTIVVLGAMTDIKIQKVIVLALKGPYIQSER